MTSLRYYLASLLYTAYCQRELKMAEPTLRPSAKPKATELVVIIVAIDPATFSRGFYICLLLAIGGLWIFLSSSWQHNCGFAVCFNPTYCTYLVTCVS